MGAVLASSAPADGSVTDLFCGAGGSSLGATAAGATLVMAANHWQTAIDVHQAHFPNAGHDCADISQADPRRYPKTQILLASPECFTAGHLVLTKRGMVPIEEVVVGDMALTHFGRWRPVVRVQARVADTVVVKGQGHTGIETTATHSFWARTSGRKWHNEVRDYRRVYGDPDWIPTEQLIDGAALWSTPVSIEPVDEIAPPFVFGLDPTAAWWLVGRWLGDGSLSFGRNHEVVISCGFHEVDELRERLRDTGIEWAESPTRTAMNFYISDEKARDWLDEHCGHGAANKQVPVAGLCLPRSERAALLDGYLSADGGDTQRRHRCSTISRKLAIGVRLLAESLGHRVAMAHDKRTRYEIEGRTGDAQLQWILHWEPKLAAHRSPEAFIDGRHAWSRVRSVTAARTDQIVYNIEVADDHSYVLDGIVVKNCTNHSQARGVSRKRQDPGFWDAPDPAAERSRATMWDVVRFAEQIRYDVIVVENVVEATKWILWDAWRQAMESLGYTATILSLNSMHHQVPQSRDRIYIVWARAGLKIDLELELTAPCPRCERRTNVRQAWKADRRVGRYRQQYEWRCTTCNARCEPDTEPAAKIIDWALPCPRIGSRARPLADATRGRILAGLQRYGWAPITTSGAGNVYETTPGNRARPVTDPLPVQQTTATSALATPPGFLFQSAHGGRSSSLDVPHPTVCASDDRQALVIPLRSNGIASRVDEVVPTVTAGGNHHGLLMRNNTGGPEMVTPTTEPARTMTTAGHQSLLIPNNTNNLARSVDEPVPTLTTGNRVGLLASASVVDDCGFRMLEPFEVAAAMAFPDGYVPRDLPKKDQVKLAGNAVTPPVMTWIMGRVLQALEQR